MGKRTTHIQMMIIMSVMCCCLL